MPLGSLANLVLMIDGTVLLAICLRESLTGSWLGAIATGSLGLLFVVGASTLEKLRRSRPGP